MLSSKLQLALGLALRNDDLANELVQAVNTPLAAISGDIILEISPATATHTAATGAWTKTSTARLVDSQGNLHTWANMTLTSVLTASDTSVAGTASTPSANLVFSEGEAVLTLNGSNHAWLAAQTATLTIANLTILGNVVTGGTFVVTVI